MKIMAKTLGALALQILLMAIVIMVVALVLWLLVPAAFPALGFGFTNAVNLSGLLFVAKAIFVVK